jgi:hypothetical protein
MRNFLLTIVISVIALIMYILSFIPVTKESVLKIKNDKSK